MEKIEYAARKDVDAAEALEHFAELAEKRNKAYYVLKKIDYLRENGRNDELKSTIEKYIQIDEIQDKIIEELRAKGDISGALKVIDECLRYFDEINAKSESGVDIESNVRKMFLLEAKVEILDYDRKVLFMVVHKNGKSLLI